MRVEFHHFPVLALEATIATSKGLDFPDEVIFVRLCMRLVGTIELACKAPITRVGPNSVTLLQKKKVIH